MNKWEVLGHAFGDIDMLLLTECENMAVNCSRDPGFEQMYEHYAIMLRTLTNQHRLIQDAFGMLEAQFSTDAESDGLTESTAQSAGDLIDTELKASRSHYVGVKSKELDETD